MNYVYSGVTSATPKETDYTIGSNMIPISLQNAPYADWGVVEANQNREVRYRCSCVLHACCGAICDFYNESYDTYIEFIRMAVDEAVRTWVIDLNLWMNVSDWVDVARRIWNTWKPEKQVNSFRIPYADPILEEIMGKGHSIVTAYRGNIEWENDVSADWVLNKGKYSPTTFAHSVRARNTTKNTRIVNSYQWVVPYNQYQVPFMHSLVNNGVNFWDCFYVFIPKEWQDEETDYMLNAVRLGIWSGDRPNDIATRYECATMLARNIHGKLATASVIIPFVWNWERKDDLISESEIEAMFTRAGYPIPRNCTRWAIAEVLGRFFNPISFIYGL